MQRSSDPDRILMGVFGAPQGVKGEVRIKSHAQDPMSLAGYAPLSDATGQRLFVLEAARPLKDDMIVARVAGIASRDAAQALTGVEIFALRAALPAPAEGEFYYSDLIGLSAELGDGTRVGRVEAVQNYGAGDILEIKPDDGGPTLLLAFTQAFVPHVDVAAGRLTLSLPVEIAGEPDPEAGSAPTP